MEGDPFIADVRLNGIKFAAGLVDYGCRCHCYATINDQLFRSLGLPSIPITPRRVENATGDPDALIDGATYASIDIDGHQQRRVFFYVVPESGGKGAQRPKK
jgi:hypothetical protein